MAKLLLLLLCICVVHASKRHFILRRTDDGAINITENLSSRARNLGRRALNFTEIGSDEMFFSLRAGGSDVGAQPNMLAVVDKNTNSKMGIAAAYNQFWVVASSKIWPAGTDRHNVYLYANVADVDANTLASAKRYKVKETRFHQDADSIMVIRVCPDLSSFLALPAAGETVPEGTDGEFYNFMPSKLKKGIKKSAAGCECDSLNGWNENKQSCMQESSTMYNKDDEKGSLLVVNNKLVGIGAQGSSSSGESYWNMEKYEGWVSNNTPT